MRFYSLLVTYVFASLTFSIRNKIPSNSKLVPWIMNLCTHFLVINEHPYKDFQNLIEKYFVSAKLLMFVAILKFFIQIAD
jgi:hypothetical protein